MTVYELRTRSDQFSNLAFWDERDNARFQEFDGRSMAEKWEPPAVKAADQKDEAATLGDYALLGTIPVFSARAVDALGDLLRPNGELLPLLYSRGDVYAYNVTTVVDALDPAASRVTRFADGAVMWIDQYVFKQELLDGIAIFKIPELPRGYVFLTESFAERVTTMALAGIECRRLCPPRIA